MQGVTGVVHGACQLRQHPPLAYHLHRVQRTSKDRARPPHQFVDFASVPVGESTSPAGHCVEQIDVFSRVLHIPKDLSPLSG